MPCRERTCVKEQTYSLRIYDHSPVDVSAHSSWFDPVVDVQPSHCIHTLDELHVVKRGEANPATNTHHTGIQLKESTHIKKSNTSRI